MVLGNVFKLSGSVESHLWVWPPVAKMAIFEGVVKKSTNPMLGYGKSDFMGLQGMFMRTWDYNGFAVGPVLALLEHIFDPKIMHFFGCMINRPDRPIIM